MKSNAQVYNFQVHNSGDVKHLKTMGLDEVEQRVEKRSTYKFILKYELQATGGATISNYGKVQFSWKTDDMKTDGGVLAYTVACNMERRQMDFLVDRADDEILKKNISTEIKITFTNL